MAVLAPIVLVIVGVAIYFIYQAHIQSLPTLRSNLRVPSSNFVDQQDLKTKNYQSYQVALEGYASEAINSNDYNDGSILLDRILKNVPAKDINDQTYMLLMAVAKHNNDSTGYNKYEKLMIAALKREGDTKDAAYYQQQLDSGR